MLREATPPCGRATHAKTDAAAPRLAPDPIAPRWKARDLSENTQIEWTDATWNPVRGCTLISPGCAHCYAERFAERFRGVAGHPYEQGFDLKLVPEKLAEPFRWTAAKRVFVNSMSDLFHEGVPVAYITRVLDVMRAADWHSYQTLTKRAERMRRLLTGEFSPVAALTHLWWGVSVENKRHGIPRITELKATPAARRFLSIEPLLEDLGALDLAGIDWVIVGGESGPGARPMREEWVASIISQCREQTVPIFFKQWGGTRKGKAGRSIHGRTYDDCPTRPNGPAPDRAARMARLLEWELRNTSKGASVPNQSAS
jgi:protein gp37